MSRHRDQRKLFLEQGETRPMTAPFDYPSIARMIDHALLQPFLRTDELEAGCTVSSQLRGCQRVHSALLRRARCGDTQGQQRTDQHHDRFSSWRQHHQRQTGRSSSGTAKMVLLNSTSSSISAKRKAMT